MAKTTRKRRGRPAGSVLLTLEIHRQIVSYVEAGSWDYVAAEAGGIEARTFRDWIARGEGRHATRSKTPQLAAFAADVRKARAKARAAREIVVADRDPKFWLQHAARSKEGREGWTDPVEAPGGDERAPAYVPDQIELAEIAAVLAQAGVLELAGCGDADCTCSHHGGRDAED